MHVTLIMTFKCEKNTNGSTQEKMSSPKTSIVTKHKKFLVLAAG